jgi:hypothetical protein
VVKSDPNPIDMGASSYYFDSDLEVVDGFLVMPPAGEVLLCMAWLLRRKAWSQGSPKLSDQTNLGP